MLSLIEVTCPHCAARGQIMLPPIGAIVIGPCPECSGMVVVFCGQALPLDGEIMNKGDNAAKRGHVGAILADFIRERVERLFSPQEHESGDPSAEGPRKESATTPNAFQGLERSDNPQRPAAPPITPEEFDSFVNVDLRLLDNSEYFKAIFDRP